MKIGAARHASADWGNITKQIWKINIWKKIEKSSKIGVEKKRLMSNLMFFDCYCQSSISGRET